jgi:hypothetical protein
VITILARVACLALGLATIPAAASERAFVLNPDGGINSCDLSHNPYATAKMAAYCSGATVPSADPARFDCSKAEVDSEYRYCGKPFPRRAR